ncbi:MAG: outer membrane protein assembly factor BamC [Methylobacter sp.]
MNARIRLLVIGAALVNLPACSYIKNLFPDKEKDYQFTTEIPPLVLPPDLAAGSLTNAPAPSSAAQTAEKAEAAPPTAPVEEEPAIERKAIQVELVDAEQGNKKLHLNVPVDTAWRMVGKALSRNSVEVTNRSQDEKLFVVQYDPSKQEIDDESIWAEAIFFLEGLNTHEQEFELKLVPSNRQTDVLISDREKKPASNAASLSLLMLLHDTIKADLAK